MKIVLKHNVKLGTVKAISGEPFSYEVVYETQHIFNNIYYYNLSSRAVFHLYRDSANRSTSRGFRPRYIRFIHNLQELIR